MHKVIMKHALVCAVLGSAVATVQAQEESTLMLGKMERVEISAQRTGPLSARNVLSSVDMLGPQLLQDQQVQHAWELFARAPGVMLTQFRQGNESGKL